MADMSEAIRKLTFVTSVQGADDTVRKLGAIDSAHKSIGASAEGVTAKTAGYDTALQKQGRTMADVIQQYQKVAAAQRDQATIQARNTAVLVQSNQALAAAAPANDNYSQASSHLSDVLRIGAKTAIDHAASWLATAGAVGAGVLVFGGLLAILGPIVLAYKLVKDAINLATSAWDLGTQKLADYVDIAKKAAAVDLTTSYFQKLQKGAEGSRASVDDLTKAFTNLQRSSADQLGGSAIDKRLAASVKVGNFSGNSGVDLYNQANTTQQKFEAIVSLVHQAMDANQRLAAIDITKTAFGQEAADNLTKDSEYLDKMVASAAKVSDKQIISDADVGRALDLQNRYDAAVKILEERWHPIQDLLTQGGINMHAAWVGIVESVASVVDGVTKLIAKLASVPAWFQSALNTGANWVVGMTTTPESRKAAEASSANLASDNISSDPKEIANVAAINAASKAYDDYKGRLQNAAAWEQQAAEASAISGKVYKDTSHAIDEQAKSVTQANDAVDSAINTLQRHTLRQKADADAIGLGAGALAGFRVDAAETAAVLANGGVETAAQRAQFAALKTEAIATADGLAKLKVAAQIDFAQKTAFLSPQDVQIAQQLSEIYGNNVPKALASTEAAQMRTAAGMKSLGDAASQFGQNLITAFASGKSGLDALLPAMNSLASQLTQIGSKNLIAGVQGMFQNLGTAAFDPTSLGLAAVGVPMNLLAAVAAKPSKKETTDERDQHRRAA